MSPPPMMTYLSVLRGMVMRVNEPRDQDLRPIETPGLGMPVIELESTENGGDFFARYIPL